MRRREKIRREFLELQRYRVPPGGPKPPRDPGQLIDQLMDQAGEIVERAKKEGETRRTEQPKPPPQPRPDTVDVQPRRELVIELRDNRGNSVFLPLSTAIELLQAHAAQHHAETDHQVDSGEVLAAQQHADLGNLQNLPRAQGPEGRTPPVWVRIPPGDKAQPILETIARLFSPLDAKIMDGLRALLGSPQFQQLFQGDKMTQGATQLMPNHQLVGVILPQGALGMNPEAAKALLIAQGLPAELIHGIPDRAVAGALNSLLQTGALAGKNPMHFMQSIVSVMTLAGVPIQQTQMLLLSLMQEAKRAGIGDTRGLTPEALQALAARLFAANHPQLLGLNQSVQESFGLGITKILNAFIRVFMGGALMQTQSMWPQAVPNERMLAELGGLFAAQHKRQLEKKDKEKSAKRGARRVEGIDESYPRVERKDDLADETERPQPEMASIFLDLDSEED